METTVVRRVEDPISKLAVAASMLRAGANAAGHAQVKACSGARRDMEQPNMRTRVASGFTLLELLTVMVIIGLLAGFVAPRYFAQVGKSQVKVARAQIDALDKALDQFRLDVGRYPTSEEGLQALVAQPSGELKWAGPYLKKGVPPDPWGRAYLYQYPGTHGGDFDLASYGKDGRPGGAGEDADLTSW
jgi:general secretion pathway protein G